MRRAHSVHPITPVQTEYSLFTRDPEDQLLPAPRELGPLSLEQFQRNEIAREKGVTSAQRAPAWVLAQDENVVPIRRGPQRAELGGKRPLS